MIKATDGNQAIIWDAQRRPFGERVVTTAWLEMPLGFPGQYSDSETSNKVTVGVHFSDFSVPECCRDRQAWGLPAISAEHGDPHAGKRGRYPLYPDDSGACESDLYPGLHQEAEAGACGDESGNDEKARKANQ